MLFTNLILFFRDILVNVRFMLHFEILLDSVLAFLLDGDCRFPINSAFFGVIPPMASADALDLQLGVIL